MRKKRFFIVIFPVIFSVSILTVFLTSTAFAAKPVPVKTVTTSTISIPPTAFNTRPSNDDPWISAGGPSSSLSLWAPLELPDGASITKVSLCVIDRVPGNDWEHSVALNLFRTDCSEGAGGGMGTVYSLDYPNYYNSLSINSSPVNNTDEAYSLQLFIPSIGSSGQSFNFLSAQVQYQIP